MTTKPQPAPPHRVSLGQPIPVSTHFQPSHASISQSSLGGTAASQAVGAGTSSQSTSASSSLVNPTSLALSLPHSNQSLPLIHVDAQALHYLTLEMPNALRSSARRSMRRTKLGVASLKEAGFSVDGLLSSTSLSPSEELEEEVIKRLEVIGSHVGANFAER